MASLSLLISTAVTLFVVVDPIGLAPTFLAVTEGLPPDARRRVGLRACVIACAILMGVALIGDWLLKTLAIGLPAFRIAGGLLLFFVASEMVLGVRNERQARDAEQALEEHVRNIAAFPLAIPLMAGPGAITATVLLAGQTRGDPLLLLGVMLIIVATFAICFVVYWFAVGIARFLGATGNVVLSRLLGVVLAALAVQYVIDGVHELWGR